MKNYKIKITYLVESDIQPEIVEIQTSDIEWTMSEYQRNRKPFTWEIINE